MMFNKYLLRVFVFFRFSFCLILFLFVSLFSLVGVLFALRYFVWSVGWVSLLLLLLLLLLLFTWGRGEGVFGLVWFGSCVCVWLFAALALLESGGGA